MLFNLLSSVNWITLSLNSSFSVVLCPFNRINLIYIKHIHINRSRSYEQTLLAITRLFGVFVYDITSCWICKDCSIFPFLWRDDVILLFVCCKKVWPTCFGILKAMYVLITEDNNLLSFLFSLKFLLLRYINSKTGRFIIEYDIYILLVLLIRDLTGFDY